VEEDMVRAPEKWSVPRNDRRASTPRRGAGLGWGLVAAAKEKRLPHVERHPT
jgi:hypothetical protein